MGKVFEDGIDERLAAWIGRQRLFFVGTAPSDGGHVNVSPKGPIETLRVLGPHRSPTWTRSAAAPRRPPTCATTGGSRSCCARSRARRGSCACTGAGTRRRRRPGLRQRLAETGARPARPPEVNRAIVDVDVERVADSCGYGVPLMDYEGQRPQTARWAQTKLRKEGPARSTVRREANATSIDGLPAFDVDPQARCASRSGRRSATTTSSSRPRSCAAPLTPEVVRALCDRHTGVGADGVLELLQPDEPGFVARLRIFNPDGSEAELSGNGVREAILYLRAPRLDGRRPLLRPDRRRRDPPDDPVGDDVPRRHGPRALTSPDYPGGPPDGAGELSAGGRTWRFQHVSIGNPQCAIALADPAEVDALDLAALGPEIEHARSSRAARTSLVRAELGDGRHPRADLRARGGGDAVLGHRRVRRGRRLRPARRRLAGDRPARRRRARGRRGGGPPRRPHGLGRAGFRGEIDLSA